MRQDGIGLPTLATTAEPVVTAAAMLSVLKWMRLI